MTVNLCKGFYHPTIEDVVLDRQQIFPERVKNIKDFLSLLEQTPVEQYFDLLSVHPLFRNCKNTVEKLEREKSLGNSYLELPSGMKRIQSYQKAIDAANPRDVYLGFHIPNYGIVQLTQVQKAAELYVWSRVVDKNVIKLVARNAGDDVYKVKSRSNGPDYLIHFEQDSNNPLNIKTLGHNCKAKSMFGYNGQLCFNFKENENPLWCSHELAVLLHRKFVEEVNTPLFFPILSGRMNRFVDSLRRQVAGEQHSKQILQEAYLNKILIELGMPGNLVFDSEPKHYLVDTLYDTEKHTPDMMFSSFDSVKVDDVIFYNAVLKKQFDKTPLHERMQLFSKFVIDFKKRYCRDELGNYSENAQKHGALLDIINIDQKLFPNLCLNDILNSSFNMQYLEHTGLCAELFHMNHDFGRKRKVDEYISNNSLGKISFELSEGGGSLTDLLHEAHKQKKLATG